MKNFVLGIGSLAALGLVTGLGSAANAQTVIYDLGNVPAGNRITAFAVNNRGQVVGAGSVSSGQQHGLAFLNNATTDFLPVSGTTSAAFAQNNSGDIAGYAASAGGALHAFAFRNGFLTDLGVLPGGTFSYAYGISANGLITGEGNFSSDTDKGRAILSSGGALVNLGSLGGQSSSGRFVNSAGQVAGVSDSADDYQHAFLYTNGMMIDLNPPKGGTSNVAGLNEAGQVAGYSTNGNSIEHAFLYSNKTLTDLGTLGGSRSMATALNERGEVAGQSEVVGGAVHGFLYTNGAMQDMGTLGGNFSTANALNNAGQSVGTSRLADGKTEHAFLYANGAMTDLNTLLPANSGWTLIEALAISDTGFIVGNGKHNGAASTFLLGPAYGSAAGQLTFDSVSDFGNVTVPVGPVAFAFRRPGSSEAVFTIAADLSPAGSGAASVGFGLNAIPAGTYDVAVKGRNTLGRVVPNVAVSGSVSLSAVLLSGGDATGDNAVDIGDFGLLVNAYNGDITVPGSGYDTRADFNYDGVVDIADFGVLVNNYNQRGQ